MMVQRHHQFNGDELGQTPGDGEGQGVLVCYSTWDCRVRHHLATEQLQSSPKALISIYLPTGVRASTYEFIWWRYCETQNSGLRSKEEKPRDPINQPSRCNMQECLLSVAQPGDSDLLGGRAPRTANWASFLYAKKTILSAYYIRVTK